MLTFSWPLMSAPILIMATPSSYIVTLPRSFLSNSTASQDCSLGVYLSVRYIGAE